MNWIRFISRIVFLLLVVALLIDLNGKTTEGNQTIVEFKLRTLRKIQADSLGVKHQLGVLLDETDKFMDEASRVRQRVHHLMGVLVAWGMAEFYFYIRRKKLAGGSAK